MRTHGILAVRFNIDFVSSATGYASLIEDQTDA
jgi:hypothetical protein